MITRSNPYSVDMIPCDSGKLRGIKMIGERYGFNEHQVMAFGDSENDLEMLTHVEYGIAMGNASDLVKQKRHMSRQVTIMMGLLRHLRIMV